MPMSSSSRPRPRIYLAGPDVFLAERIAVFAHLRACCEGLGLEGVEPSDGDVGAGFAGSGDERAQRIYDANVALLRSCDGVAANLCAFRGLEPDSGTVFEVGYAIALGKPVVGYGVAPGSYAQRVEAAMACHADANGRLREAASGTLVEGMGQRLNLMLTRSASLADDAESALRQLAAQLVGR
jgi:nucleoside 2-deoxyribosyltransferase